MKKLAAILLALVFVFSVAPMPASYAAGDACEDNVLDQVWDWFTTLGKEGVEKQRILAENKADRLSRCAERQAKKAQAEAQKQSEDTKKKFGL